MKLKFISKNLTAKTKLITFTAILLITSNLIAQDRPAFRSGYIRLGINSFGKALDNNLSPKENIFKGNYGAGTGFVLETGRVFYFLGKNSRKLVNVGLDWTYFSLNYNKLDKWDAYGKGSGAQDYMTDGTKIAAAISGKLGPVLSFNPVEKLVIDLRAQIAPTFRFFDFNYQDEKNNNSRYFSFTNYQGDSQDADYDGEAIKNRIAFGFQKSFGITIRRKAVGLSMDYVSGDVKSNYEAEDSSGSSYGKVNIPVSNVQLKLSFTL